MKFVMIVMPLVTNEDSAWNSLHSVILMRVPLSLGFNDDNAILHATLRISDLDELNLTEHTRN
jgi:hypothetical protein